MVVPITTIIRMNPSSAEINAGTFARTSLGSGFCGMRANIAAVPPITAITTANTIQKGIARTNPSMMVANTRNQNPPYLTTATGATGPAYMVPVVTGCAAYVAGTDDGTGAAEATGWPHF